MFLAKVNRQNNLGLVSLSGEVRKINDQVIDVLSARQHSLMGKHMISAETAKIYSDRAYFDIFDLSLELIPVKQALSESSGFSDKDIIKRAKQQISDTENADIWSLYYDKKRIHQTSIIDLDSSNLDFAEVYPSTPTDRSLMEVFSDENYDTTIKLTDFTTLEYQTRHKKPKLTEPSSLKKAIAEATELGFSMEDLGSGHLEADLVFEAYDGRSIRLAVRDYDYTDDTIGEFHYTIYESGGSNNKRKTARLDSLANTFYSIQKEMVNDAY